MKFETTALIKAIDQRIKDIDRANAAARAEAEKKTTAAATAWVEKHGQDWRTLATTAQRRIKAGKPITKDDVPVALRGRYDSYPCIYADPRPSVRQINTDALRKVRAILVATTDETVTTTSLREIGFKDIAGVLAGLPL